MDLLSQSILKLELSAVGVSCRFIHSISESESIYGPNIPKHPAVGIVGCRSDYYNSRLSPTTSESELSSVGCSYMYLYMGLIYQNILQSVLSAVGLIIIIVDLALLRQSRNCLLSAGLI